MPQDFIPTPQDRTRIAGPLSRLIDGYHPGITLLVSLWVMAHGVRDFLSARGALNRMGYEALTSLVYVIPIMLAGWALLRLYERYFGVRD